MREPSFYIGKPVTSLQTMLRVVAAQHEEIPSIVPDGIYGAETMRAVNAFQRRACLPATGITDLTTWNAIRDEFEAARIETEPAEPLQIDLSPNQTVEIGSSNLHVLLIQAMLHTIAEVYGNMPESTLCGICDEQTVRAVKAVQRAAGMPETGIIDKEFWRLLVGLYAQATGNGETRLPCVQLPQQDRQQSSPTPPATPHGDDRLLTVN